MHLVTNHVSRVKWKQKFKQMRNKMEDGEERGRKGLTDCEVLLSSSLVLFPRETAIPRFLLRRAVIHRFDFVRLVRVAGFREIREKRENCLGYALILARVIPREENSASHQWQSKDIWDILAANTAQPLKQNHHRFVGRIYT